MLTGDSLYQTRSDDLYGLGYTHSIADRIMWRSRPWRCPMVRQKQGDLRALSGANARNNRSAVVSLFIASTAFFLGVPLRIRCWPSSCSFHCGIRGSIISIVHPPFSVHSGTRHLYRDTEMNDPVLRTSKDHIAGIVERGKRSPVSKGRIHSSLPPHRPANDHHTHRAGSIKRRHGTL